MKPESDVPASHPGNVPLRVRSAELEPVAFREHTFRFLIDEHQSGGTYSAMEISSPPGTGPEPHVHDRAEEGFYVLDGGATFFISGDAIDARPGDWIHVPRGVVHAFRTTANGARYLAIYAPGSEEQGFREAAAGRPPE